MGFKTKMIIYDIENKKNLFEHSFEDSIEPDDEISCINYVSNTAGCVVVTFKKGCVKYFFIRN